MFNAPRPAQPYGVTSTGGLGASFVVDNPLTASMYDSDGLDPWSAAPSPAPPALPSTPTTISAASGLSSVIGNATVPDIYHQAFTAVDTENTGEISVNGLSRVLGTAGVSASTIERIVSVVSSRSRVSRLEFFVALALIALAQQGKDLSIERVALLAQSNLLPSPDLDLSAITTSNSAFNTYQSTAPTIRAPIPTRGYSSEDPWNAAKYPASNVPTAAVGSLENGAPSSISGTGLPRDWWKKQEIVNVNILGQQGFLLNRYLVYEVSTDQAPPVPRRYSEFVILWDCIVKRYPFRLIPQLPPKRIGPDGSFIEQRRRGLARFINFVVNHPVIKEDSLLAVFLTEPSFEAWRKHSSISYEEESASKRIDRVEEMSIPSDLEEKLASVRGKINSLIEQWQKICTLAERMIKRREAAAVRLPPSSAKRTFMPSHFALPPFGFSSAVIPTARVASYSSASTVDENRNGVGDTESLSSSIFSGLIYPHRTLGSGTDPSYINGLHADQADGARLTNTIKVLVEVTERCWRGDSCVLCAGVRQGVSNVADHMQRHADALEHRALNLLYSTLESLKSQRDLYIATRDLFIRHDRLSGDQVDKLKKRVESNSMKLEAVKQTLKDGWQVEADKLTGNIEKDQAAISASLNRRVFIRACMWHELRVVLHNRENTLLTDALKIFVKQEHEFAEGVAANWASLSEAIENMPYE